MVSFWVRFCAVRFVVDFGRIAQFPTTVSQDQSCTRSLTPFFFVCIILMLFLCRSVDCQIFPPFCTQFSSFFWHAIKLGFLLSWTRDALPPSYRNRKSILMRRNWRNCFGQRPGGGGDATNACPPFPKADPPMISPEHGGALPPPKVGIFRVAFNARRCAISRILPESFFFHENKYPWFSSSSCGRGVQFSKETILKVFSDSWLNPLPLVFWGIFLKKLKLGQQWGEGDCKVFFGFPLGLPVWAKRGPR